MTSGISRFSLPIFSFTLLLSAAIMFSLQPMVGKMLLPLVGGTPAGWIVAMAFFQVMLLAGYLFAHLLSRLSPRAHGFVYIAALGIGAAFLPVTLGAGDTVPNAQGAGDIFRLLAISTAIPFIALSATSSTIQRLFTATGHSSSSDPYFLYAASNLGSMGGLFLYPLVIEPAFTLTQQSGYWTGAYAVLIVFAFFCTGLARFPGEKKTVDIGITDPVNWKLRFQWALLAFLPSSLLLGVTTHITTDIVSAPMLWVLPLGLYLLTFVIAFAQHQIIPQRLIRRVHPVAVAVTIGAMTLLYPVSVMSWPGMACHLAVFTIAALMCHMRLAELRPADSDSHLTEFYLMISIGGALGGLLNAFVIPVTTSRLIEYPLVMMLTLLVNPDFRTPFSGKYALAYFGAILAFVLLIFLQKAELLSFYWLSVFFLVVFIAISLHPKASFIACFLLFFILDGMSGEKDALLTARNFYGVIRVYDRVRTDAYVDWHLRYMTHGTTVHGVQIRDEGHETQPTSYFAEKGPLGDVFGIFNPQKILVLGLGTGTINCYSTPEREMTFIEIDPLVVEMAKTQFTFLSACKGKTEPRIIIGDGRLELAKLEDEKFDLMIMDAFSSDMVPTHLITREAVTVYAERLNNGGAIVVNVSNRYFELKEVIALIGKDAEFQARYRYDSEQSLSAPYTYASQWVVLTKNADALAAFDRMKWEKIDTPEKSRMWTDNYSSFLQTIRFSQ